MANLLSRLLGRGEVARSSLTLAQLVQQLNYQLAGYMYPVVSYGPTGRPSERPPQDFESLVVQAYAANPIVYGLVTKRALIFSEARFMWQEMKDGRPGDLKWDESLALLDKPWPNGSTGELLMRIDQDVSLAGNAYIVRDGDRLRRLRPDWVQIVLSGDPREDHDIDVLGYVYGAGSPDSGKYRVYLPDEVAHISPVPDPLASYRGMSWLTPVLREIRADQAATDHKLRFMEKGAVLGPIVKAPPGISVDQFRKFIEAFEAAHAGKDKAYAVTYLANGADVTLAQADMRQLDFKALQGHAETRMCVAALTPAPIAGVSEGLQGASLNTGNYAAAKRQFADGTLRPLWRIACAELETIIEPPEEHRLWFDESGVAFLRDDQQDVASIQGQQASTINTLITAGFTPESIVIAVKENDLSQLKHSGLTSVQLTPPQEGGDGFGEQGEGGEDPEGEDEYQRALEELRAGRGEAQRSRFWVSRASDHWRFQPRVPRGDERGGQWVSGPTLGDIAEALQRWTDMYRRSSGDPLGTVDLGLSDVDEVDGSFTLDDPGGVLDDVDRGRRERIGRSLFTYATSTTSQSLNEALRQGGEMPPWMRAMVEDLDAATEMSRLSNHAVVYRGIRDPRTVFGDAWNDDDVTGLTWTEDGFLSTSADERIAGWFTGDDQVTSFEERLGNAVVLTIVAPRGTGAVRLSGWDTGQAELMLQRGLTLRVVRDEGVDSSGIRRLDVEVVGAQP